MKKTSLILLFVAHCFSAWAQFENKISISAAIGIPFIKSAGIIQAENIYYGYGKIPTLKIGMQYNIKPKFGLGPVIGQLYSTKPNFKLTVSSFGIGAKYNFVPFDKKISPFLYLEGDINYVTISQKANSVEENPEVDDKEQIMIVSQIRNYPEILTGFTCMGVVLGAGS
ncbi:MAG TPA: hypothetical protein DCR46_02055, partial [Cytophagales bacterium]|nr:hypothetical protein [Cytophagales bacterium]